MPRVGDEVFFGLVRDFLKIYLPNQKNSSSHTVKSYKTSLDMLIDFAKQHHNVSSIGDVTFELLCNKTITAYLDWLEAERGCGITTRNQRLACVRAFFKYAADRETTAVIYNIELRKIPKKKVSNPTFVEFMSEDAVKALLEQPDVKTKRGLRDQFLMVLAYDTAARISEILSLKVKDIHLGKEPTATLLGKGPKIRIVPLSARTVEHFKNYMQSYHPNSSIYSDHYLFYVMRHGEMMPMSDDNVLKFMKKYGIAAKSKCGDVPDNVHPHLWRHSRAMHLYQGGMDLTLVSQWLGHSSLETTLIYAHADTEQKRKAIEKATSTQNPLCEETIARFREEDEDTIKRLYGLK